MKRQIQLEIEYHKKQRLIFEDDARFKVIAKGRRFGLTRGFALYVIESMFNGVSPVLWVDTVYGNIDRYIERYFHPVLKQIPKKSWRYRQNRNELRIGNSVCDFRSADNPENIEGFGYALIIVNEAGIVLKNRSLWNESILPMILDYKADVIIGGTPKGKTVKRTGEKHLFYELFQRGENNPPLNPLQGGEMKDEKRETEETHPRQRQVNLIPTGGGETNTPLLFPSQEGKSWKSFNYSSYDNPILDANDIDELVKQISPALRDQEIFGKFVDKESSGIIKREWWRYYKLSDELYSQPVYKKVQSWDTAFKKNQENDFSVCTTWLYAQGGYYLLDVWRGRVEFPELKRKVVELAKIHNVNEILIEDKASGQSLIQELQRNTSLPIKPIKVESDKIARVHSVTPLIEAGKVFLPESAHWLDYFLTETEDFPGGEFDDVVDSVSQFLNSIKAKGVGDYKSIRHVGRTAMRSKIMNKIKNKLKAKNI